MRFTETHLKGAFVVEIDGRTWTVDAARVDAHTLSLLIGGTEGAADVRLKPDVTNVHSHEVTLAPDAVSGRLAVSVGATTSDVSLNARRRWGRRGEGTRLAVRTFWAFPMTST